ncbi:MAG: pyridoxamine 5'-phosphate oxidase family protein [Oscillospiraceae bacterium]|nr:pyridoxamine 5'-phosphate oxidase family protein [Oscillospiraceae bacterium]
MGNKFRPMRRFRQHLTDAECREVLKQEMRGTLAVNGDDGYPYAFPINYYFNEKNGTLYLHCAKVGYKIDAIRRNEKVCFCLHDEGYQVNSKWQRHFKSIVIFGRVSFIEDFELAIEYTKMFDLKFETAEEVEKHVKREGSLVQMLELTVDHMTGKRVIEG